jgi:predicted PurR-regulated permease PerM
LGSDTGIRTRISAWEREQGHSVHLKALKAASDHLMVTWPWRSLASSGLMPILDKRTASVLLTILVFVAAGAFIYAASRILVIFLLSIFFAYLLEPLVSRFQRWTSISRGSRGLAILEVYVILCASIALVFLLLGLRITDQTRSLTGALPGLFQKLSSGQIAQEIGSNRGWSDGTQIRLQQFLANHRDYILSLVGSVGARVAIFFQNVIWIVLIPILAVFFLKDGRNFTERLLDMVERAPQKRFLAGITDDLDEMLAHYIRTQLVLAGLSLAAYIGVLSLLRVPYAAAVGAVAGVLEFVPVVGPLVGAAAILGVAFLANYHHVLIVAAFLGVWRLLQDYLTTPRLMGRKLELHPLAVIFAVLVGAEVGGVIGIYLSIPVAAALRIVWKRWQRVYAQPTIRAA